MKNILFVIPNLKIGGTTSSLSIIYKELRCKYNISVMSLARERNSNWIFDECLLKQDIFFSAYHENPNDAKGLYFLFVVLIKLIKRFLDILGVNLQRFLYKKKTTAIAEEGNYDIVVAFEEGMPTFFVSYFNIRKIAWIHCNYAKYCPKNKSELEHYNKYERIICVAEYTRDVFVNRYPSLEFRTDFIYNMINTERISAGAKLPIDDIRFVPDVPHILVSAGRIDPVKRFSQIPLIAKQIHDAGIIFKWYILGPEASADELKLFFENNKKNNTEDCVFWLGNKTNPYNYFACSSLYVCTSASEACPMVFNEAMYVGVPVLSTDFGSAKEFIEDGVNGIVCPFDKLADVLCDVLRNDKVRVLKRELHDTKDYNKSILNKIECLFG